MALVQSPMTGFLIEDNTLFEGGANDHNMHIVNNVERKQNDI